MRFKSLLMLAASGLTMVAMQAHAVDDRMYLVPSIGYISPDGSRNADDGWGAGLGLGKALNENWNLEAGVGYDTMDRNAGGNYDQYSLGVDALRFFNRNPEFSPYAVMGLGYLRTKIPGETDNSAMANLGLGFLRQLNDKVALRADARYRWNNNNLSGISKNGFGDWLVTVGLQIALGEKPAPAPVAQPEPKPEPAVAMPEPEPVAEPAPAPTPVAEPAPQLKTEQAKELDKAKPGDVVVILQGVNFEFDSAKLRPGAIEILNEAVTVLKHRSEIKVDIVGHTCNIGTKAYNQGLSERRAKSVYDFFVSHGIAADRLTTKGYGETRPAFSNATREGRAKNRRVELYVK